MNTFTLGACFQNELHTGPHLLPDYLGTWDVGMRDEGLEDIKYRTRGRVGRGRGDVKYRNAGYAGCE